MKVVEGCFLTHDVLEFVCTAILDMLVTYNFKEMISCGLWVEYQKHMVYHIEVAIDSYLPQSEDTSFSDQ